MRGKEGSKEEVVALLLPFVPAYYSRAAGLSPSRELRTHGPPPRPFRLPPSLSLVVSFSSSLFGVLASNALAMTFKASTRRGEAEKEIHLKAEERGLGPSVRSCGGCGILLRPSKARKIFASILDVPDTASLSHKGLLVVLGQRGGVEDLARSRAVEVDAQLLGTLEGEGGIREVGCVGEVGPGLLLSDRRQALDVTGTTRHDVEGCLWVLVPSWVNGVVVRRPCELG